MKKSSDPYGAASRPFTQGFTLEFRAPDNALSGEHVSTLHFEGNWLDHFRPVVRNQLPHPGRIFR